MVLLPVRGGGGHALKKMDEDLGGLLSKCKGSGGTDKLHWESHGEPGRDGTKENLS